MTVESMASDTEAGVDTVLIHEGVWITRSGAKAEVFFSDEFGYVGRVDGFAMGWYPCGASSDGLSDLDIIGQWEERTEDYREYRPDERDELRGRWFRFREDNGSERMVDDLQVIDGKLFVCGWSAADFLENCCWLDGGLCGKVKFGEGEAND